ncbi:MAG: S41 family peptidase [Woeseiaceae bacterium]|nr:S41 family peptidase [Woeseiaceae bacterium]
MRILISLALAFTLSACEWSSSDGNEGYTCSNRDQKRFVRDAADYWYLWNDLLPKKTKVSKFDTPVDLLDDLTSVQPLDTFSYLTSAVADAAFFGAGQYEGFGFSRKFLASDDVRLTRVFTGSPAEAAGFARGQRIVALDGRSIADIEAAEGIDAVLDGATVEFTLREIDGVTEFTVEVTQDIVTIDPLPQTQLIPTQAGPPVGYLELAAFINTANAPLETAFADFQANGVTDLIVDLRYNSGGLVATADLFANLLGGAVAENLTFTRTLYNPDRSEDFDTETFFELLANSINLSRLVVITTASTASASEIIINGMEPHVEVTVVGDQTFGKPVGQIGLVFCGAALRLTAFETVNANNVGGYFGGLPADCPVADDLDVPVGDAGDPNVVAALGYLETGACPAAPAMRLQPGAEPEPPLRPADLRGPAWREFAGAY